MPRSKAPLTEETNVKAVQFIEQGLREHKTVGQILAAMRQEAAFAGISQTRLHRQWNEVWRPLLAKNGTVELPRRGGRRGPRAKVAATPAAPLREPASETAPVKAHPDQYRQALEEMVDLLSAMLAEGGQHGLREAVLRAFPGFVRAVRAVSRTR